VADHIAAADRSIAVEHSTAVEHHSTAPERNIAVDHSRALERSIAGTERRTPGMVRREGSRVSSRHVLASPAQPSSPRQSEAFS
jgi:tRNA pseudouridine-54 N-methylase